MHSPVEIWTNENFWAPALIRGDKLMNLDLSCNTSLVSFRFKAARRQCWPVDNPRPLYLQAPPNSVSCDMYRHFSPFCDLYHTSTVFVLTYWERLVASIIDCCKGKNQQFSFWERKELKYWRITHVRERTVDWEIKRRNTLDRHIGASGIQRNHNDSNNANLYSTWYI